MTWICLATLVLLLQLTVVSCAHREAAEDFESLANRYWAWRQQLDPAIRDSTYQQSLYFNYSQEAYRQNRDKAAEFLFELLAIDSFELGPTDSIDYNVLSDALRSYIAGFPFVRFQGLNLLKKGETRSFLKPRTRKNNPFKTMEDFRRHEEDISDYCNFLDQIYKLLEEAVQTGKTLHNVSMVGVVSDVETSTPGSFNQSVLWKPYLEELEDNKAISDAEREKLRSRGKELIVTEVIPKLKNLQIFLVESYLPATRQSVGVSSWPGGKAYYAATLRWHLTTEMSPREVYELGKQEVARLLKEIATLKDRMGYTDRTVPEFLKEIKENPKNYLDTKEEVLNVYKDTISSVAPVMLNQFFQNVPNYPIKVVPYPGLHIAAAYAGNQLLVDTSNPKLLPAFSHRSVCLHEAVPGHHTQKAHSKHQKRRTFRAYLYSSVEGNIPFAFPRFTAYVEGWALYAESLGEEVKGVFRNDLELLGRHSEEMFRAVRLVLDPGLHCFNWTRQQAIDYMMSVTIEPPEDAANEVDRYITNPGQAAGYKVGELKFKALRHKAAKELGEHFNLRAFHTHILESSEMSLPTLLHLVDKWIEKQKRNILLNNQYPLLGKAQQKANLEGKLSFSAQFVISWLLRSQSPNRVPAETRSYR